MASNAVIRKDPAGNIKPDKERATAKIDGIVAAIIALVCVLVHQDQPAGNIW
jgi:phage terminase large subunit-like protein